MGVVRELVLVGGGHSHVQVLRRLIMEPLPDTRVTVVVDRPVAVYSGMVPGFVARQYEAHELEIDVRPLARRAGARFVVAPVTRVDAAAHRLHLEGRPPLRYDVCSLNVGSTVAGLDVPGVREHALATRPIGAFVASLDARAAEGPVVVVGGGAAGVELAFTVQVRLGAEVTLVDGGEVLSSSSVAVRRRVREAAARRGIAVHAGTGVARVEADRVVLRDGRELPCGLVLWAAGAAAHRLLADSGLPVDERGFVRVRDTLQVHGHDALFAAGDCAVPDSWPQIPKAGVYAVRQGPVLADNLRARLSGRALRPYRAQRDFLALLNLGDGTAIGGKWGLAFEGAWVFSWKDRIDRRFMRRFQALDPRGIPLPDVPEMDGGEMICGGCAAKVADPPLRRALARLPATSDPDAILGVDEADDVVALRRGDEAVVVNVDAFPAFTDDPWLVGRVAAENALSDLYAKGVAPRFALALVGVPEDEEPEEGLFQVLSGIRAALDPAGTSLLGGHTTVGPTWTVGLSVTGFSDRPLLRNTGVRPGDRLVLTRPLGTGVLFHADMAGRAAGRWMEAAVAGLVRGNAAAARAAEGLATAATDVTGFGLAGHLAQLLRQGDVSAELDLGALPVLPGALELLARGERSTFHDDNARLRSALDLREEGPAVELLFDPQTAGGLLLAVPEARLVELLDRLEREGETAAATIGRVTAPRQDGALISVGRMDADPGGRRPDAP